MLLNYTDLLIKKPLKEKSLLDSVSMTESLFQYGLNCIIESNNEIRNILFDIMIESGYMITEGFKDEFNKRFNFNNIVSSIISLFIKIITKLFNKGKAIILNLIYDNKTIEKYKNSISSYDRQLEVDFDHYNYSYLDKDIPSSKLNLTFSYEYEELQDKLERICKTGNKEKILHGLEQLYNSIQMEINHGYFDKLRRSVLADEDYKDVIFADRYDIELKKVFRSGSTTANKNDILPNEIHNTLKRFLKGKDMIKSIEKHKKEIEIAAEKSKKNINKISVKSLLKDYVPIDYDLEFNLNRVLKIKCGQLSECCNIYTLAFAAKLDAIKESLIQDKKVLFTVISDIIVNGGEIE